MTPGVRIGFQRENFMFYAYTPAKMNRLRALVLLLAPFFFLTLIPFFIEFVVGWRSGWMGVVAICNAALSANDLLLALWVFLKVPRQAKEVHPELNRIRYR